MLVETSEFEVNPADVTKPTSILLPVRIHYDVIK